jgi:hypothetical protein
MLDHTTPVFVEDELSTLGFNYFMQNSLNLGMAAVFYHLLDDVVAENISNKRLLVKNRLFYLVFGSRFNTLFLSLWRLLFIVKV